MGTFQKGILGGFGFSGKVGTVIGGNSGKVLITCAARAATVTKTLQCLSYRSSLNFLCVFVFWKL